MSEITTLPSQGQGAISQEQYEHLQAVLEFQKPALSQQDFQDLLTILTRPIYRHVNKEKEDEGGKNHEVLHSKRNSRNAQNE